jgi:putative ABC transport system substrate-binding protein
VDWSRASTTPGGNVTGVTSLNVDVGPKRLELLHELVPAATIVALFVNPANPINAERDATEAQKAALTLGVQLHVLQVSDERDFTDKFGTLVQLGAGALLLGTDALFTSRSEQLAALALHHMLPTISPFRRFVVAGGLASYGGDITESWRLAGVYTARVLKGEKPVDLPVIQSTKVELAINLKTAKALGIAVSLPLQGRADEVIE